MKKIWYCKIGEVDEEALDAWHGADLPMRLAIEEAYIQVAGESPKFIFSGWGAELTEAERDVLRNLLKLKGTY